MPSLLANERTLLGMAPQSLLGQLSDPGALVAATMHSERRSLMFVYVERNAADPYRNWERYYEWKKSNNGATIVPGFPDHDAIYSWSAPLLDQGKLSRGDKALLLVSLGPYDEEIAHLRYIRRHQALKGTTVVADFIGDGLATFLRGRGFRYLKSEPVATRIATHLPLGQPARDLEPEMQNRIGYDPKTGLPSERVYLRAL